MKSDKPFLSSLSPATPYLIAASGIVYAFFLLSTVEPGGILAPARLDLAFNYYALSILDGRLDIPAQAIGLEGRFTDDGRVYMYYGVLPALLRIPLAPFIDLSQVGLARVMVFVYCVAIGLVSQWLILRMETTWRKVRQEGYRFWTILALVLVWFASPIVILASAAAQTYEPIALALLITVAFFAIILNDAFVKHHHGPKHLILLAVLAGLAVHSRPNVAIALYFVVVAMSIMTWFIYEDNVKLPMWNRYRFNSKGLIRTLPVFLILMAFGASLMALNYARGGSFTGVKGQYGYWFIESENSPRRVSARKHRLGTFSVRRLVPNAYYHMYGEERNHRKLLGLFGGGHVTNQEPDAKTIAMWGPLYIGLLFLLIRARRIFRDFSRYEASAAFLTIIGNAAISYMILSYLTITYRYKTELWPLVFFGSLIYIHWHLSKNNSPEYQPGKWIGHLPKIFLVVLTVIAVDYNYEKNRERGESSTWYRDGADPQIAEQCVWDSESGWPEECKYLMK